VTTEAQAKKQADGEPPLPEPRASIGVLPDDPLAEAGRKVLLFHFAEMLKHEAGTRQGEDIEDLHKMRVATRRMRAAFEVFGEAFKKKALEAHLPGLKATGRALGKVRDLDVLMEAARHYRDTLPEENRSGLDPLLDSWKEARQEAREEMLAYLDSADYAEFKQKFNRFLQTPGAGARRVSPDDPTPNLVQEVVPALVYTRLGAVRAYDSLLEHAQIEQLHALRIEFKKLRYAMEFFQEVLGPEAEALISDLKKLQDHLGELHDAQVATEILLEFLDEWEERQEEIPISERQSAEELVNYLAARHADRHALMISFHRAWDMFNRPEFRRNLALAVSVL
jgi:CHAD domain-containing protein